MRYGVGEGLDSVGGVGDLDGNGGGQVAGEDCVLMPVLRNEVELGAWFIFPADTDAVFNSDPGSLWPQMIRKTEQKLAESEPASPDPWTRACPSVE